MSGRTCSPSSASTRRHRPPGTTAGRTIAAENTTRPESRTRETRCRPAPGPAAHRRGRGLRGGPGGRSGRWYGAPRGRHRACPAVRVERYRRVPVLRAEGGSCGSPPSTSRSLPGLREGTPVGVPQSSRGAPAPDLQVGRPSSSDSSPSRRARGRLRLPSAPARPSPGVRRPVPPPVLAPAEPASPDASRWSHRQAAASETGQRWTRAGARWNGTSRGLAARVLVTRPRVVPGEHALVELSAQLGTSPRHAAEIRRPGLAGDYGDAAPHLFVFAWAAGRRTCYDGCGWADASTDVRPGDSLAARVGTEVTLGLVLIDGAWWAWMARPLARRLLARGLVLRLHRGRRAPVVRRGVR